MYVPIINVIYSYAHQIMQIVHRDFFMDVNLKFTEHVPKPVQVWSASHFFLLEYT